MRGRITGGQDAAQAELQRVPKLRFPKFEGEWEELMLGEVGPVLMCKRIFKDDTTLEGDVPFYKIGTFGKEPDAFISREKYDDFRAKFSFPLIGEIMISAAGTIGRTVVYDGADAYFQDSNIVWIANDEAKVLNRFLNICYQNIRWTTENNTIARLYNNNLKSKKITIPSLPEQKKIAAFLGAVDEKLAALRQRRDLLTRYKRGLMQKLFAQTLRFTRDDGTPFPDWEEKRLGEIAKPVKRTADNPDLPVLTISAGSGFLDQTERFSQVIAGSSLNNYTHLKQGEFSYNRGASKRYKYGCIYLLSSFDEALVPFVYRSFRMTEGHPEFFEQYFIFGSLDRQLRRLISSSARMDGLLNIGQTDFYEVNLKVPHPNEQQKIAAALQAMDAKIDAVAAETEQIETFKKALLQQMFV